MYIYVYMYTHTHTRGLVARDKAGGWVDSYARTMKGSKGGGCSAHARFLVYIVRVSVHKGGGAVGY